MSGIDEDLARGLQLVSGGLQVFGNGFESLARRMLMLRLSSKDGGVK